ncbi:uncharacterized protein BDV14DRAFT_203816 [Aspergillus stella-maris]|uniref:uncharacterized protein n=1 Tax=Aspergillus stella-maris TaxID=1810926 RepID=UPI003CCD5D6E
MKGASETGLTTPDKTIKKEDEDDTYSAFGDPWAPGSRGKERSASPMQEEEQEKLQDILREHCQAAIPKLKEYISGDQASATSLEESNVRLQGLISNIMGRPISGKAKFRIPYEKIKDVVDPLVVQPLQNPSSETQENEYATKLGESRIGLYHVCLQSNIDISWLKGLLGTERHTKHVTSNPLYSSINTDVTTYWPYSFLETSNYVILYEKQIKISSDRNRSSFGVQVFDPNTKKFRVETRATINNDDLQRWRVLPNAFKFEAANRGFDGGKDSIDYIYFYTMKQPKTGGPDSLESAHTDVCVKPKNSMFPRLLPRSQVNGKLADGESIEPILEIFSGRDDIKKPWGFRAKKMVCDLTGEKAKWRPQTTLEEEFWKLRNEGAASLRGVSPFSNAPASPENTALAEKSASRASPFSQRSYSQRPSLQEKTPVVEDQEELGRQGMEIEKIKKRLDNIEDNLVTPAYIDNAMERNNKKLVELIKGQSAGEG